MNQVLKEFLANLTPGPVSDAGTLEALLAEAWPSLSGARRGGMEGYKIPGRAESLCWNPPCLTFTIERHGGTVMGSTRAELQDWLVDVTAGTAEIIATRRRQLRATASRMDVIGIAREMAEAILHERERPGLKRYADGRVRIEIGLVIPDVGFKQTVSGRRKRFRKALESQLASHGWKPVSFNCYRRTSTG
jgi:hypothetical protein